MQNLQNWFDKVWFLYHHENMKTRLPLDQLIKAKRAFQEEHAEVIRAIDVLIADARQEENGHSSSEPVLGEAMDVPPPPIPPRTIKEATSIAVNNKATQQFTIEDIVNEVRKLYTRREVKKSAVSTALSLLKKDGKIRAESDPCGATPGTYIKVN